MFAIDVYDDSGSLQVLVFGEDATAFLPGLQAVDLYANNCSREELRQRLHKLMLPGAHMDCCIKSYRHIHNAADVRYRIFDTMLH
eukprot:m.93989 g.93989  ORF g.93989 m.93989 type:complete len:85 (-) comp8704_c0_seq2:67-321(-)